MNIDVTEESFTTLTEYAAIPIAFEVREVFDVTATGYGDAPIVLTPRDVPRPYVKDYDAISGVYPGLPNEVQLRWYKDLPGDSGPR